MEYDSDYGSDYEWEYVEDAYDEADNLAEHAWPSPPLLDPVTNNLSMEGEDPFDIWVDIEYLSDSYYDKEDTAGNKASKGFKRKPDVQKQNSRKRRRRGDSELYKSGGDLSPVVLWRKTADRGSPLEDHKVNRSSKRKPVALLKDWKQKFEDSTGFALGNSSKSAAESTEPGTQQEDISGDGFDLSSIESIAGVLPEEAINTLKEIVKAKGLDPEAVQAVLQDLIEGREPDFGGSDGEDEKDEEQDEDTLDASAPAINHDGQAQESPERIVPPTSTNRRNEDPFTSSSTSSSHRRNDRKRKIQPSDDDNSRTEPISPLQSHAHKKQKQTGNNSPSHVQRNDLHGNSTISQKSLPAPTNIDDNENAIVGASSKSAHFKVSTLEDSTQSPSKSTTKPGLSDRSAPKPSSKVNTKGKEKRKAEAVDDVAEQHGSAVDSTGLRRSARAAKKPRAK